MVKTASTMLPLGTPAPDFSLVNVDGRTVSRADFEDAPGLLVIFMCNHCPFVVHVADELAQLAREYQERGFAVVGINSTRWTHQSRWCMKRNREGIPLRICLMRINR